MKIGILGQGASGLFLALMLKYEDENNDVVVIDKNTTPGRKLLATGNGRCNLGNRVLNDYSYNDAFGKKIVEEFNIEKQIEFLNNIGILTRDINNLVYPFSLSARSLLDYLVDFAKQKKVKFVCNENVINYETNEKGKIKVTTSKKTFIFDKFIIASGNGSAPQLGGSTSILSLLNKKGYKVFESKPGLCPLRTIESTKNVENQRIKAKVTLIIDRQVAYEETGEVLFKKDGLSGIAIFNCASILSRSKKFKKATIKLDLLPDVELDTLLKMLTVFNVISDKSLLNGMFTKEISEFIRKNSGVKNLYVFTPSEIKRIANYIKNIEFTYKAHYDFNDSQVCVGGLDVNSVDENMQSKTEKNVYFIGEVLNVDGLCGGLNIMFAIASAHKALDSIIND